MKKDNYLKAVDEMYRITDIAYRRKKALFFVPLLMLLAYPSYALTTINAQSTTSCDMFGNCQTVLDLSKAMTAKSMATVLATNYSGSMLNDSNITMNYRFNGTNIIVYGKVYKDTYWSLDLKNGYAIDPWWNTTWKDCKNLTIMIYRAESLLPVVVNVSAITLNNSYEGRLIDEPCQNDGSEVNYTVIDSKTDDAGNDWVKIEFPLTASANETWSFYYNNPTASDAGYLFTLFHPNMTAIDWTNDWYSGAQAKYSAQAGYINMTAIAENQWHSDQIQSKNDFSSYGNVTVFIENYLTSAAGTDESYSRFFAGTKELGTWNNYYDVLWLDSNNYRVDSNHDTVLNVSAGNPAVQYQKNISWKIYYAPSKNRTEMFMANATDTQLWSINLSNVNTTLKFWGSFTDYQESPIWYYIFKIYLGRVNPRLSGLPSISLGEEEEYQEPPPDYIVDNTVICFQTQPVCINLKDSTLIYKGEGYYA